MITDLTTNELKKLKKTITKKINKAESIEETTFILDNQVVDVSYAKYLMEFVDTRIRDLNNKTLF